MESTLVVAMGKGGVNVCMPKNTPSEKHYQRFHVAGN